jgi:hypothetical protein
MCAGWVGGRRRRRRMVHWWRRRWRLRAAGHTCLHFIRRRVTGARGYGRAFGPQHLPPRRRPRLAGGLRGGQLRDDDACVQRQTRWDKESLRHGGRVAGVARVCRMGRRRDGGGGGGGGRWNGVGRGRWGAGGRVHRQDCADDRAEARIGRWGGEAWGKFQCGAFSRLPRSMRHAEAGAQILVPGIGQTGPRPKKFAAPRRMQRLLEERFRDPALHIGGLYSTRPI